MAYPSSLDSLRTDLAGTDDAAVVDHAGLHNAAAAAVMAVQAELGLDPSGAAATVAARLAAIEADSRWTNARTPTAHKASHAAGGSDALSPADIGAATSAQGAKADTAVQPTLIDAKGDLLVGAAADNLMRLPAAADGQLLTTDGSQAAGMRWATPTTRVGSGSPLGIVVPDFAGQEWVDTQQTLGARKWVATGTTAASWIVSDGETPWYTVTPINGWTGSLRVRRLPDGMDVQADGLGSAAATSSSVWLPTPGFRWTSGLPSPTRGAALPDAGVAAFTDVRFSLSAGIELRITAGKTWYGLARLPCADVWPTAAPV